jgi:predicted flap endonuclease-1-like 5' DNA nuclease
MFEKMTFLSAKRKRFSPWWFGLKFGFLVAIVVWWWLQDQSEMPQPVKEKSIVLPPEKKKTLPPKEKISAPVTKPKPVPVNPDDLTRIDGIGPKYAKVLMDADVKTYAQLAAMDAEVVQDIFRVAVGRAPDPSSWIEQAASLAS